jgi:hypothetical protein
VFKLRDVPIDNVLSEDDGYAGSSPKSPISDDSFN